MGRGKAAGKGAGKTKGRDGEVRLPGVELHGSSFRYRSRVMREGKMTVSAYKRWPFLEGADARHLPPHDPLHRKNALAHANLYATKDSQDRLAPKRLGGVVEAEGTFLEWLVRYRVEGLELAGYEREDLPMHLEYLTAEALRERKAPRVVDGRPRRPLTIQIPVRSESGAEHDIGQIRTLFRIALNRPDIKQLLDSHVQSLGSKEFNLLLSSWSDGKARPATKRRLLSTLNGVWNHHRQYHSMLLARPSEFVKVLGDGSKSKARALKAAEIAKVEAELGRLHPSVRGAIEFLRWTGARRAEAAKLKWDRIVWPETASAAPTARFERTKAARGSYRERFTYLEPGCVVALAQMVRPVDGKGRAIEYREDTFDCRKFKWPTSGWVFPSPNTPGEPVAGQTVYQAFVRSIRHAGLAHASPHHLRHTKATVLTATVPQAMAQELLGHEDAATFARYRHLAEEAGYMVRDRAGQLVNAENLKGVDSLSEAIKKLSKKDRAALMAKLVGD
jgi:integrase